MNFFRFFGILRFGITALLCVVFAVGAATGTVSAQQATSTDYQVDEAFFGTGGLGDDACSGSYCAKQSAGEFAQGFANSTDYQTQGGFNTNREEYIEFRVNDSQCSAYNTNTNLGYLSQGATSTTSANFSVKTYLASSGYIVTTAADPPTSNGPNAHTFATPNGGAGTNPPGTEQFGINLAANSTPAVGQAPTQLPDSSFSYGAAASNYATANSFRYVKGETIANANRSSGTTCYVVSYLFNISDTTPAGEYTFNHVMVATSTY